MAYTEIHAITVRVNDALNYGIEDKVKLDFGDSNSNKKDDVMDSISYAERDKEIGAEIIKTLSTGINCTPENARKVFQAVQDKYKPKSNRKNKNLAYHLIQTFDRKVEPKIANEIGRKMAQELFNDYCCVISTHDNTEYTHNHIIINAWNNRTGKKFNDNLECKRSIRRVSDRLCEEYDLGVIEDTREMKVIHYKDENGVNRFYEKTERKEQLKREGNYSNNDYRNSNSYIDGELYKRTNKDIIKEDIEKLLPHVKSYEELLDNLRGVGYEIKDKKSNGDWRKHISFKAPMQEKFTRDNAILNDDGEVYTREYLVAVIEDNLKDYVRVSDQVIEETKSKDEPIFESNIYQFGRMIIEDIDEDYRRRKNRDGGYRNVARSGIEIEIIKDTKKLNKEIDIDVRTFGRIPREPREQTEGDKYTQYLIDRINGNLSTLQFVEQKNIQSFKQINDVVRVLYDKRNMAFANMNRIAGMMKKLNENIVIIDKYNDLLNKIEIKRADINTSEVELQDDEVLLKSYQKILEQRKLVGSQEQEEFKLKVLEFKDKFNQMGEELKKLNEQLQEYDNCVYNLNIVDKENDHKYTEELNDYNEIKEENKNRGSRNNFGDR